MPLFENLVAAGYSFDFNMRSDLPNDRWVIATLVEKTFDADTFKSLLLVTECAAPTYCALRALKAILLRKSSYGVTGQMNL